MVRKFSLAMPLALGTVLVSSLVSPAFAKPASDKGGGGQSSDVSCSDTETLDVLPNYSYCVGPVDGNDSESAIQSLLGSTWEYLAKDDNGNGINDWGDSFEEKDYFSITGGTGTSGTWTFDETLFPEGVEEFAIAIKGGPTYSLYIFDDLTQLSGGWDTLGVAKGNGKPGPGLSHFSVYIKRAPQDPGPRPVPEPISILSLLAFGSTVITLRQKK